LESLVGKRVKLHGFFARNDAIGRAEFVACTAGEEEAGREERESVEASERGSVRERESGRVGEWEPRSIGA
jgi:hypothetical protein